MRYEDASLSGSFQDARGLDARDDADALAAGSKGPATGNTITGAGTLTGSAGADLAAGATITNVQGAGGSDSSFANGQLRVAGEHGTLVLRADGNYSYTPRANAPENVRDVFTYTLADASGGSDRATLTIELGKTQAVVSADAQRVVPGPDGVVVLPAGVDLSDVIVVGRDLVIMMPNGQQMVIVDGAVFVPQLVINDVEVPATNLAALLIDLEPQPAAGIPQSSGGNFGLPVGPLDPGVPLGDLIPQTELGYVPPEFEEVFDIEDREPEAGAVAVAFDDDDVVATGNPGGIGDDLVDGSPSSVSGFLPGSGGDGDLTFDVLLTGAPVGFTYVAGTGDQVLVQQGGVTVLTIDFDADSGEYTITQNAPIDHAAGGNENNIVFELAYTVRDDDGDTAVGSISINVDDDTPTAVVTVGSDANVLLVTDDADTDAPTNQDVDVTVADFDGIFSGGGSQFGADGPGTVVKSYAVSAADNSSSGLTSHGQAITLYTVNGVVVGATGAKPATADAANVVFSVSVDNNGVVTLTQYQPIDHAVAEATGPYSDDIQALADGLVTLTRTDTITDGDGDQVAESESVAIGANLQFTDDGPAIGEGNGRVPNLVVDESPVGADEEGDFAPAGVRSATVDASGAFGEYVFGADGPGSAIYTLQLNGEDLGSGLFALGEDGNPGAEIQLVENGDGTVSGIVGEVEYFTISVDGDGKVTFEQLQNVYHGNSDSDDDTSFLNAAEGTLTLALTVTDFDNDSATQSVDLSSNVFRIEDDGPVATTPDLTKVPVLVVDESPVGLDEEGDNDPAGVRTDSASFAEAFGTPNFGTDGPGSVAYTLQLNGENLGSGLFALGLDGQPGAEIQLRDNGDGTVSGVVGESEYFTISVDANGVVTFEQLQNVYHDNSNSDDDSSFLQAADGTLLLVQTVTDADGDSEANSIDLGSDVFAIEDDGPVAGNPDLSKVPVLVVDESPIGQDEDGDFAPAGDRDATADFSVVFGSSSFGTDGPGTASYALSLNGAALGSGLFALGANGQPGAEIQLVENLDGSISGVVSEQEYFTITVNQAGQVTFTQKLNIYHDNSDSDDDTSSLNAAPGTIILSRAVTDADGDSEEQAVDLSTNVFQIEDDGPSAGTPDPSRVPVLVVDESPIGQDEEGDFTPAGVTIASADFSAAFGTATYGTDGAGSIAYALQLNGDDLGSGLFALGVGGQPGAEIQLRDNGDGTISGVVGEVEYFTISADGSGNVTFEQLQNVYHANSGSDDDTSSLDAADGTITLEQTVTDADGDSETAAIDLSNNVFRIEDDGPVASTPNLRLVPVLVVDESPVGQDEEGDFDPAGVRTDSADFSVVFGAPNYGTDGAGSVSYALSVNGNTLDSGLYALGTNGEPGAEIQLVENLDGTISGKIGSTEYFTISVDQTGEVTFTQKLNVYHANEDSDDDTSTLDAVAGTITLDQIVTDADGDSETVSVDLSSGVFSIEDDGPNAQVSGQGAGSVILDETRNVGTDVGSGTISATDPAGRASATIDLSVAFVTGGAVNYGTDGAATGSAAVSYALLLSADGIGSGLYAINPNDITPSGGYGKGAEILLSEENGVITGSAGGVDYFTITIDPVTGIATFTQLDDNNIWHPTPGASFDEIAYLDTDAPSDIQVVQTVTDRDGDSDTAAYDIGQGVFLIQDDGPVAVNDTDQLAGGEMVATGNVLANDDVGEDDPGRVTAISFGATTDTVFEDGVLVVAGQYGTLRIEADGDYEYTRAPGSPGKVSDTFTYTLTDADGDTTTATLVIGIDDSTPTLATPEPVNLDDDVIPGLNGNPDGIGDDDPDVVGENSDGGTLLGSGGDGDLDYFFSATQNGLPTGFAIDAVNSDANTLKITQLQNGVAVQVLTVELNNETGAYTVTQDAAIRHPSGDNENNIPDIEVDFYAQDVDGSQSPPATLVINVDDDTPVVTVSAANEGAVLLETTDVLTDAPENQNSDSSSFNFGGVFALAASPGADGTNTPAALTYSLGTVNGTNSGLTSAGQPVYLYKLASGAVVGSTVLTGNLADITPANTVFQLAVVASGPTAGTVTLTQYQQLDHPDTDTTAPDSDNSPADNQFISMLDDAKITLTASATVTDRDNDAASDSETINIAANLRFYDDGPTLTNVAAGSGVSVDETTAVTPAGFPISSTSAAAIISATAAFGADGPAASASTSYGLTIAGGGVTALKTAIGDHPITLMQTSPTTIEGQYQDGGTKVAFTVSIGADGKVTLTENVPLEHNVDGPPGPAHDDTLSLTGLVNATITIKDFDGDVATATAPIGDRITFFDDGPDAVNDTVTMPLPVDDLGVENIIGTWVNSDFNGGSAASFDRDGDGSIDELRWGTPVNNTPADDRSGYGWVDNATLLNQSVLTNTPFSLGTFTHYNNPITGTELDSTVLSVTFKATVNGQEVNVGPILITFDHDETTNTGDPDASRDIISISGTTPTVVIDGVEYQLEVTGLVDENGNVVDTVRTFENQANSYQLLVRFVATDTLKLEGNVLTNDAPGADGGIYVTDVTGTNSDSTADVDGNYQVNGQYGTLTINKDGTYVYQLTVDPLTVPEGAQESFTYGIIDNDGDTDTAVLRINLDPDAVPQVTNAVAAVDDDGLAGANTAAAAGDLDANAGEPGATPSEAIYQGQFVATFADNGPGTYSLSGMDGMTGQVGTETVTYSWNAASNKLTATGPRGELFNVTVNPTTGAYTVTLVDNVLHAAGNAENDATTVLRFSARDADGDTRFGDLTITFDDDVPVSGFTTQSASVTNVTGSSVTRSLDTGDGNIANNMGADGGKVIFADNAIATLQGQNLKSNGSPLSYEIAPDGQTLRAFVNVNATAGYQAGTDTPVFTMQLQPGGAADSNYQLTFQNPVDQVTNINFNDGTYNFVGGNDPWAGFTNAAVGSKDLLLTPLGSSGSSINGNANAAGAGGGGGGQNIQTGEGMRLDFVIDLGGDPAGSPANYQGNVAQQDHTFGNHYLINNAVVRFGDGQTNTTISIRALDASDSSDIVLGNGAPVSVDALLLSFDGAVREVKIADGLNQIVSVGSPGGLTNRTYSVTFVETAPGSGKYLAQLTGQLDNNLQVATRGATQYDALEIRYLSGDDFDITGFGAAAQSTAPLPFTVPVLIEDADGDRTGSTNISVTLTAPAVPVTMDLNDDGEVGYLAADAGVRYDYAGDGEAEQTAWVAPEDGMLVRDADGNGTVSDASEFVFGGGDVSDLEALRAQYGDTLDADDADFAKFGVWQDANSNGVAEAGEIQSLAALGITGVSLVSDGVSATAAGGDVQIVGAATYTNADGSTGVIQDVAFATGNSAGAQKLEQQAANSNTAVLAAVAAAAGLAAVPAAADVAFDGREAAILPADAGIGSDVIVGKVATLEDDSQGGELIGSLDSLGSDDSVAASGSANPAGKDGGSPVGEIAARADNGPQLSELLNGTDSPSTGPVPAAEIVMPSMEGLNALMEAAQAADGAGEAKHNAVVEIVAEALNGGEAGPSIDELLNALPRAANDDGDSAADGLASANGGAVPGWDSGHFASLPVAAAFTMEATALHHDAVQPA